MATDSATTQQGTVSNFATGSYTGDGTATVVSTGFLPRWVKVFNLTDATVWEWVEGFAATQALKTVTAGTTTVDTGSAIVVGDRGFTVSATASASGKAIVWLAQ